MSTKFEQLLDLIVNEEHEKANELFHEIVVEKSREIYENLIAEEADEEEMDESADEEMDESADEEEMDESADEEEMDESADEEMDESEEELEDSYSMEADDEPEAGGLEKTDDFGGDVGAMDDEEGGEGGDEEAMFDIKNAIAELEAAFEKLEASQGGDMGDAEFGDEEGGEEGDDELQMGMFEGRRITREYTEKVGNDWDKNSQKTQAEYVGAKTGGVEGKPVEGRSPIASGANKPGPAGVNAKNLNQSAHEGGSPTGTSPAKVNKGINPESGEKYASGIHNVDGKKSGVKTLSGVKGGHGAEKKGAGPGPVGSGTGDKAGQTSVKPVQQMLKPYTK
jgi:hypothetical protein